MRGSQCNDAFTVENGTVRTLTNHNHQELLENIEVYNVTYARE